MDDPTEPVETGDEKAKPRFWPIFGWSIIGLMALLIVLNFLDLLDPVVNKVGLPVLFALYVVYVIFRDKKTQKVIE